jgi:hypothetical protein
VENIPKLTSENGKDDPDQEPHILIVKVEMTRLAGQDDHST